MADAIPRQEPYPPQEPQHEELDTETIGYSFPSIFILGIPVLFIVFVSMKGQHQTINDVAGNAFRSALFWCFIIWALIAGFTFARWFLVNLTRAIKYGLALKEYKKDHKVWSAEQQRLRAIWKREEAERQRLAEIERKKQEEERAREAARQAEQARAAAAMQAYNDALAARQYDLARWRRLLDAAYQTVKYEAGLHGVTAPEDLMKLFVADFHYQHVFKHADAGLLREAATEDPRIAAVLHMLPSLPPRPSPPKSQNAIAGKNGQGGQAREAPRPSEQEQLEAATKAYKSALEDRRRRADEFYTALKEAHRLVQLDAELRDITAPDDVLALFVEAFPTLRDFKDADAGLLRQWLDDPLVDSIIHLLPPLPDRPRKPRIV